MWVVWKKNAVGEASGRLATGIIYLPVSIMEKFYASNIFSIHLIQDHNNYFQYTFDTGSY